MFQSFSRSWRFARASYGVVWQNKRLLLFPLLSGMAAILVLASFLFPLHYTDALSLWQEAAFETEGEGLPLAAWLTLFAYYVVNYFVIVFFNAALVVCAIRHMQGQPVWSTSLLQFPLSFLPWLSCGRALRWARRLQSCWLWARLSC